MVEERHATVTLIRAPLPLNWHSTPLVVTSCFSKFARLLTSRRLPLLCALPSSLSNYILGTLAIGVITSFASIFLRSKGTVKKFWTHRYGPFRKHYISVLPLQTDIFCNRIRIGAYIFSKIVLKVFRLRICIACFQLLRPPYVISKFSWVAMPPPNLRECVRRIHYLVNPQEREQNWFLWQILHDSDFRNFVQPEIEL